MVFVRSIFRSRSITDPPARLQARRQIRFIIVFVAFAVTLSTLLRCSGSVLVSESRVKQADFAIIADWSCDRCLSLVSGRIKSKALQGVLLFSPERQRLVLLGVIPPGEELCRERLIRDGVSPDAIHFVDGKSRSDWQAARLIGEWLDEHSGKRINVLCERFSSHRWSFIFDRTIAPSNRSRLAIEAVADPRFDETNWWRSRSGIKSYFHNIFRIGYARLHGEDSVLPTDWSPEKYESSLLK
jgi:hypothetical protein